MTTTATKLVAGSQLTGSAATYYTAPSLTTAVVKAMTLANTTGGAVACTVYLVPSGGSATAANTIISGRSVAAGETYNCPEAVNQVLPAGATIQALGLNVTLQVSGVQIT